MFYTALSLSANVSWLGVEAGGRNAFIVGMQISSTTRGLLAIFLIFGASQGYAGGSSSPGGDAPTGSIELAEGHMRAFKAYCPSHGVWAEKARTAARALASHITQVKDDPACKSLAASLTEIETLSYVLSRESLSEGEEQLQALEKERFDTLNLISQSSDPVLLGRYQQNLSELEARIDGKIADSTQAKRAAVVVQATLVTKTLMNQALLQSECTNLKPQIFTGLASLATSLGAVAASGGTSLGLAAGVELIGASVEYARKAKLNGIINQLSEASIHEATTCVLEALSNQWCGAREARDLIDLKSRSRGFNNSFYRGVRTNEVQVPLFLEWLRVVQAGARPNNSYEADRKKIIYAKEAALRAFQPTSLAILEETKKLLPGTGGEQANKLRFDLARKAIIGIAETAVSQADVGGVSAVNPINDTFTTAEIPWILAGLNEAPTIIDDGQRRIVDFEYEPFQSFRDGLFPGVSYPIPLSTVEERVSFLIERGEERLAVFRSELLHTDPRAVLWDAETPRFTGESRGLSPLDALKDIRAYIAGARFNYSQLSAQQRYLIENTIARLRRIEEIIKESIEDIRSSGSTDAWEDAKAQEALDKIYLTTPNGSGFLADRIDRIFRLELHTWILDEQGNDPALSKGIVAQLLAADDILEEFKRQGNLSHALLKSDISKALVNTSTTAQAFADVYSPALESALKFYSEKAQSNPQDHAIALADLCLLLLSVPDWNSSKLKNVPLHLCQGSHRVSEDRAGLPSPLIKTSDYYTPYQRGRACSFRNFMRQERILDLYRD